MKNTGIVGALVVGLVCGSLAGGAVAVRLHAQAGTRSAQATTAGRYQLFYSPHNRTDTFLLDSETGRVWQPVVFSFLEGDPDAWVLQDKISTEAEREAFVAQYNRKQK